MFGMLLRWLIFIKYSDGENEISIWIVKTDPVHVSLIVQYCKQMGSVKWYEYKPGHANEDAMITMGKEITRVCYKLNKTEPGM